MLSLFCSVSVVDGFQKCNCRIISRVSAPKSFPLKSYPVPNYLPFLVNSGLDPSKAINKEQKRSVDSFRFVYCAQGMANNIHSSLKKNRLVVSCLSSPCSQSKQTVSLTILRVQTVKHFVESILSNV